MKRTERSSATRAVGRPRIAVMDMAIVADSPAGSCVLAEVHALAARYHVTVFCERFEADDLPGVEWVRVRAPHRPILLRYLAFHLGVPIALARWRLRGGRADRVQATQGQWPRSDVCYAHFCHRGWLARLSADGGSGVRRLARRATHGFNAWAEALAIARARLVVVPSRGLAEELAAHYPGCADRLRVLSNPVDVARFARPATFDRCAARARLGIGPDDVALAFMALGDFDRKGLGLLLDALVARPQAARDHVRLLVIGGCADEIAEFEGLADRLGVRSRVHFVGLQDDVRPFLWACDAFALPSAYETFGLAVVQAMAAGLPALVCAGLHGIEDVVVDGRDGWVVARTGEAVADGLARIVAGRSSLVARGDAAMQSVQRFAPAAFGSAWLSLFDELLAAPTRPTKAAPAEPAC